MNFSLLTLMRQVLGSLWRMLIQPLRRWTKPDNHTPIPNAVFDLARSKSELMLENALLRQQLIVLQRHDKRPALTWRDRSVNLPGHRPGLLGALSRQLRRATPLSSAASQRCLKTIHIPPRPQVGASCVFFVMVLLASKLRSWKEALIIVQPDTLLRWHRDLFRRIWRHKSKPKQKRGRKPLTEENIALIKRMAKENLSWGAERIRGELLKLQIEVSKSTIQKYINQVREPADSSQQTWSTFLRNHATQIWACDFLQTYDLFFRSVFVFVIIELGSRRLVHFGVTRHPTDAWVAQQLREATPFGEGPRYLIHDNDRKYGPSFARVAQGIEVLRTPYRAPRANAICERFLGSVRRECLDFFLIFSERHLHQVMKKYQAYYNDARPHQGIKQRIPCQPERQNGPPAGGKVVSHPLLGGLHHDYYWQAPGSESLPRAA